MSDINDITQIGAPAGETSSRGAAELLNPIAAARELGISYHVLNSWRIKGCPVHNVQRSLKVVALYNLEEVRAWRDARAAALAATRKELTK